MMTEDGAVVSLKDDFYRDGFVRIVLAIVGGLAAVLMLLIASIYLYMQNPKPITFGVAEGWRVIAPVPVEQPYLTDVELTQWVSNTAMDLLVFDFSSYEKQLNQLNTHFTSRGWEVFLSQLSNYANKDEVLAKKMFVNGTPAGAPVIINKGVLSGRYAWWVKVPMLIQYVSDAGRVDRRLVLQILVVRVSTLNNLSGVAIENIIVPKGVGR